MRLSGFGGLYRMWRGGPPPLSGGARVWPTAAPASGPPPLSHKDPPGSASGPAIPPHDLRESRHGARGLSSDPLEFPFCPREGPCRPRELPCKPFGLPCRHLQSPCDLRVLRVRELRSCCAPLGDGMGPRGDRTGIREGRLAIG